MYTSKPNTVLTPSTSKWTFVHPWTFVVDVYTTCCHHKSSHRTLPSRLGVGGNVQSSDVCIYFIGRFNQTIVHACVFVGDGTLTHKYAIAQGKSARFGRLCYIQFTVNLGTSFVFITLP